MLDSVTSAMRRSLAAAAHGDQWTSRPRTVMTAMPTAVSATTETTAAMARLPLLASRPDSAGSGLLWFAASRLIIASTSTPALIRTASESDEVPAVALAATGAPVGVGSTLVVGGRSVGTGWA